MDERRRAAGLLGAVLVALVWVAGCAELVGPGSPPTPVAAPPAAPGTPAAGAPAPGAPPGGLPVVVLADLPPEAAATVALIDAGGPYPYRQDDAVFENREGLLPERPAGYYREYTVPTPGSPDRGARRIVRGQDGEMYWTSDHYDSFAWIDR